MTDLSELILLTQTPSLTTAVSPNVGLVLREHLENMGQDSLLALALGLRAFHVPGASGALTIHVPRKLTERIEIEWRAGPSLTR
jgi:hypothetical protein